MAQDRPSLIARVLTGAIDRLHRFQSIDRRWLFLAMAVVIVVPLLLPIGLPIQTRPEVRAVYDAIRSVPPGGTIIVAADYDPASMPELQPFFDTFIRLAFARDVKLVVLTLWPQGPPLIDSTFKAESIASMGKEYGVDYVNLGFKEGKELVMTKVGESLVSTYPTDTNGTPVKDLPILAGHGRLENYDLMVCISSGHPGVDQWIRQVQGRFINRIVAATTSVIAPDVIPFLDSGQLEGLVGGMSGAAQFEQLAGEPGAASGGMDAQNFAHVLIILAVILANIAYFTSDEFRRRKNKR